MNVVKVEVLVERRPQAKGLLIKTVALCMDTNYFSSLSTETVELSVTGYTQYMQSAGMIIGELTRPNLQQVG